MKPVLRGLVVVAIHLPSTADEVKKADGVEGMKAAIPTGFCAAPAGRA